MHRLLNLNLNGLPQIQFQFLGPDEDIDWAQAGHLALGIGKSAGKRGWRRFVDEKVSA